MVNALVIYIKILSSNIQVQSCNLQLERDILPQAGGQESFIKCWSEQLIKHSYLHIIAFCFF